MVKNLEEYTPQEIVTQTDTSLEPPKKISPETEPDKKINTPEPQPAVQIEKPAEKKPPIDPEELDKAKKHLEELYAPIDAGANTPEKFSNVEIAEEKNTTEQVKSESADKSIPIEKIEPQENKQQETPEQLEEKKKAAEEFRQKQIETAKSELEAQLQIINEAREKKDATTELSNLKKAETSFEIAEGKSLVKEAVQRADVEIKQENLVRMSREQYEQKYTPRVEADVKEREKSKILTELWTGLTDKEKAVFNNNSEEFTTKKQGEIIAKIAELEKQGITVSENAFYAMMENGLNPEQIKPPGWFSNKIKISHMPLLPGRKGEIEKLSKDDFFEMIKNMEKKFTDSIEGEAHAIIVKNVEAGQKMWRAKKNKCMRDVIKDTVDGYKKQKEETGAEQETKEQNKTQKQKEIGAESGPEITGDVKKDITTVWKYLREHGQKVNLRGVKDIFEDAMKEYERYGFIGVALEIAASLQEGKVLKPKKSSKKPKSE